MLTGQNGILNRAGEAKEETERSQQEELEKLVGMEALTNINGYEYEDKKTNKKVNIPAGYVVSAKEGENSLEDGLVIKDASGNEFVWVEVPKEQVNYGIADNKTLTEADYVTIETKLKAYASPYTEGKKGQGYNWTDEWYDGNGKTATTGATNLNDTTGCGLTLEEYKRNKEKMLKSIYDNQGFWISRYEIGDEEGTKNNYKTRASKEEPLNQTPVSKPNQVPYICVTCSQAQGLANKMAAQGSTVTSSLLFGIQWDLVCKYLEGKDGLTQDKINSNSGTWGNYYDSEITLKRGKYAMISNLATWFNNNQDATGPIPVEKGKKKANVIPILLTTGASDDTKKQNIYDLAGNLFEWTLEKTSVTSYPCACRGGNYGNNGAFNPASYRNNNNTSDASSSIGCRVALY